MAEKRQSVNWVIAMVMIVIAVVGWGFMAAGYAHHAGWQSSAADPLRRASRYTNKAAIAQFLIIAITQIPNAVDVVGFNVTHRIWLPLGIIVVELLALLGGYGMKQVEKSLNEPPARRKAGR